MADRVTSTEMKTQTPARGPAGGPAREFAPWIRNLLPALRGEGDVQETILEAIRNKPENHEFAECYEPGRPMTAIGG